MKRVSFSFSRFFLAALLLSLLPMADVFGQMAPVKPRRKPPTTTTSTPRPKPKPRNTNGPTLGTDANRLKPLEYETETVNGVSFRMVRVEGGTFRMGATLEQGLEVESDEKPAHQVTLSAFSIGETEVTQELWQAVMGSNPSKFQGLKRPVEMVSWEDCQDFIRRLNELTGKHYRLPTEAEWEYAARGGNRSYGYKYAGGSSPDDVAWYYGNSGSTTHDVGAKHANEQGLYDMTGNVWEWCQNWYDSYSSGSQTNPRGSSSGSKRGMRGSCWATDARFSRVSYRCFMKPSYRSDGTGLRLAL